MKFVKNSIKFSRILLQISDILINENQQQQQYGLQDKKPQKLVSGSTITDLYFFFFFWNNPKVNKIVFFFSKWLVIWKFHNGTMRVLFDATKTVYVFEFSKRFNAIQITSFIASIIFRRFRMNASIY